jgi:hypothetical protein
MVKIEARYTDDKDAGGWGLEAGNLGNFKRELG